ncbi:MAG: cyclic nucleotide-binding domain-containing protein [Anaerolineales bacterium]|nr:cyclic nucleotide-binding domain-containing protein [Anaerolineales bacterium]
MDSKTTFSFLHEHYLFKYLTDEELGQILPLFKPIVLEKGDILYRTGFPGRNFFLIVSGKIILQDDSQNALVIHDKGHFGEQALNKDGIRSKTAQALEKSTLLAVNKRGYMAIISAYPSIKSRLSGMRTSAAILQKYEFPWISKEETVHFVDRKHINVFYSQLILPMVFLILTGIGAILLNLNLGLFLPITILIFSLWSLWLWLDWQNDFYIVTSERAAWVEKVIWLHDQRREVPLQSILSVNISTNQIQRLFGYGDVIVRTYTGNIPMRNTAHPEMLLDLISEAQAKAKIRAQRIETANINQTIRTRLGLSGDTPAPENDPEFTDLEMEGGPLLTETITPLQEFINFFRARYELNGVITYRKHLFVLFRDSWLLWLAFIGLIISFFARLVELLTFPSLPLILSLLMINVIALGYVFVDWANDRFQITDKHIIDLDRKPFGRETKRSALLENVLSLDYKRENIIQRMFDYGTVAINVGDIQLDFELVAHPINVQNEIFERYNSAVKQKEMEDAQRRRDDMVEFLAAYHEESSDEPSDPEGAES